MDEKYFIEQVRLQERSLYRIAISYLRRDADAADAVQDALLKAWEKRNTLRQPEYFGTWLTRILINTCKVKLRRSLKEISLQESEIPSPGFDAPEDAMVIRKALFELDIKHRIPLVLYYLDGPPIKDIAHALQLPSGTVKSRLSRGKNIMRQKLHDMEVFEDEPF